MTLSIAAGGVNRSLSGMNQFFFTLDLLDLACSGTRDVSLDYIGWIEAILRSSHSMEARRHSAELVMRLLGHPKSPPTTSHNWITHIPTLLQFLEFCEDSHNPISSVPQVRSQLEPEIMALRYLRWEPEEAVHVQGLAPLLISVFTRVL